jgi:hypothetical protein
VHGCGRGPAACAEFGDGGGQSVAVGTTGMITHWLLQTSRDGRSFTTAAQGTWPLSTATATIPLLDTARTRAVRLVITGSLGSVAELRLVTAETSTSARR